MARGFFLLPWDESLFGLITGTGTKIRAIKIARAFVAFFSLSFLIQCIYLLKQLLSHNVTHTYTDGHTLQQFVDAIWAVAVRLLPTDLFIYSRKRQWFVLNTMCVI